MEVRPHRPREDGPGEPLEETQNNLAAYFERLKTRPSFARVLKEAEPYFQMVPKES